MRKIFSILTAVLFSATMFASTYIVAGNEALMGSNWSKDDANNQMQLVEGVYKLVKENVTLGAQKYEYKVIKDGDWDALNPNNRELAIAEDGVYNVTFTLVEADGADGITAEAQKVGDAVVEKTVAMHGNFFGNWADTELFTAAEDKLSASLTLNLAEGNYEFGMRIAGPGNWKANGAELSRENNTTSLLEGSGNMKLAADVAGEYKFVFTFEGETLEVTFPSATAITNTMEETKAMKLYENGQLVIIKNGVKYDALGQIVK